MEKRTQFIEALREKANLIKSLISNTDYMDWLYEFTKSQPKFTTNDWDYGKGSISDADYEKVNLLTDFFTAIDAYHTKYFVGANTEVESYSRWYNIKYKGIYFSIGICVGQGAFNFVARHEDYTEIANETYVELESITKDISPKDFIEKVDLLNELKLLIKEMKAKGVPQNEIEAVVKEVFN